MSKCHCFSHSRASRIQRFFWSPSHGGRQYFSVFHGPSILKFISSALCQLVVTVKILFSLLSSSAVFLIILIFWSYFLFLKNYEIDIKIHSLTYFNVKNQSSFRCRGRGVAKWEAYTKTEWGRYNTYSKVNNELYNGSRVFV